jgi:outer membrane protein
MMMTASAACVLAALAIAQATAPALAGDLSNAPALESAPPPVAEPFDPFLIRLKGVYVAPEGTGKVASTFPVFPLTALIGADVKVGSEFIPVVEASYFFTKNIAVQAVCCVSYAAVNIPALGGTVGHAWALPETVFAQYHFTDFGAFQPYVGVGVDYAHFFDVKTNSLLPHTLHVEDSWGLAGQIGFDYMINRHWGLTFDVERIGIEPNWKVRDLGATGDAHIDPWVIGAGVAYRFGGPDRPSAVGARY